MGKASRLKKETPKEPAKRIVTMNSLHDYYEKKNPPTPEELTEHCCTMTQAALMVGGAENTKLSKQDKDYIKEAAELGLTPSATMLLANVICADYRMSPRKALCLLLSDYVDANYIDEKAAV